MELIDQLLKRFRGFIPNFIRLERTWIGRFVQNIDFGHSMVDGDEVRIRRKLTERMMGYYVGGEKSLWEV